MRRVGARIVNQCEPLSLIHKTLISNFSLQISLPFFSSQRKYELHFLLSFRGTSYRAIGESYPSVLRYESDSIFLGNQSVLTLSVTSNLIFSLAGRRCFWAMIVATIFASAPSQSARHVSHNPFSIEALPPCREWPQTITSWILRYTSAYFRSARTQHCETRPYFHFSTGKTSTACSTQWCVHPSSNQHILSGLPGASAWQFYLSNE